METENRAAIIAIIVENRDSVESLNGILHEHAQYLLGRMGIPYHKKNINIISIAIDAPLASRFQILCCTTPATIATLNVIF